MDSPETPTSTETGTKRHLHRGIRTAGAVVAMVLAGLGVAEAQTDGSTTTTTQAEKPAATVENDGDGEAHAAHGPGCRHGHHLAKAGLAVAAKTIGIEEDALLEALRDGKSIAQVAQDNDVEPQKVIDAMVAEAEERLENAVESGRLTQEEADEKAADLTERITTLVNREGLPEGGPGHHRVAKAGLAVAAKTIGIEEDALLEALRDGKSIAQVAQDNDVEPQKVIDAMVAEAEERLENAVESGRLTQEEADEKAANLTERITTQVNREGLPERGLVRRFRGGPRGFGGGGTDGGPDGEVAPAPASA